MKTLLASVLLATMLNASAVVTVFNYTVFSGAGGEDLVATLTLEDQGANTIATLRNLGPVGQAVTIDKIFFFGPTSIDIIQEGPGVDFSADANLVLPSGTLINWPDGDVAFAAEPPPVTNGIDVGEFIVFRANNWNYLQETGGLAALHAIGAEGAGSYYVVDGLTPSQVPEPSVALIGGLGMLALLRRRRAKME